MFLHSSCTYVSKSEGIQICHAKHHASYRCGIQRANEYKNIGQSELQNSACLYGICHRSHFWMGERTGSSSGHMTASSVTSGNPAAATLSAHPTTSEWSSNKKTVEDREVGEGVEDREVGEDVEDCEVGEGVVRCRRLRNSIRWATFGLLSPLALPFTLPTPRPDSRIFGRISVFIGMLLFDIQMSSIFSIRVNIARCSGRNCSSRFRNLGRALKMTKNGWAWCLRRGNLRKGSMWTMALPSSMSTICSLSLFPALRPPLSPSSFSPSPSSSSKYVCRRM